MSDTLISKLRTFQDWSNDGYKIIKGSKAVGRNSDGVCLFTADQVTKRFISRAVSEGYNEDTDENCCGGPMYGIYGNCD
jgi:hypothetical protein